MIAIVAIAAGLFGTLFGAVFTQVWQSRQERARAADTRWLEERRHAYTALLKVVDRSIADLGLSYFMISTNDYDSFRLAHPIDDGSATDAASSLELIASPEVRGLADAVVASVRALDWELSVLRAGKDDAEIAEARPALSGSFDELHASRDELADAMRQDVKP